MSKADTNSPIITKQDVINFLNDMINEKNKNSITQYINKILAIDNNRFQQQLVNNNILTIEDVKTFFVTKFSESRRIENNENGQSKTLQKCNLNDLDANNTYFHFTGAANIESIKINGLIPDIGIHSEGVEIKKFVFFSKGMIPSLQGYNTWIKWIMNRMYGEKDQFGIYDGLPADEIREKKRIFHEKFLNKEYLADTKRKEIAFELLYSATKGKILLTLDLKPGIDFSFDDIDYTKKNALDNKENNIMLYLYAKEMYGEYSQIDSTVMDKWNMHTFEKKGIKSEQIMQVTDSMGRTDMLHILIEMYDKFKSCEDIHLDILGDFIDYAKQKEISLATSTPQKLYQETSEEQKNIVLLDEIERSIQSEQQKAIMEQQGTQK